MTRMPGRVRCADAVSRVLDRGAALGRDAESACGLEEDVRAPACRARPPPTRPSRRRAPRAPMREHEVDDRPVRGRGESEPERAGHPANGVDSAVDQGQFLGVALEQSSHDLVVDLLRRVGEPDDVVHVPRPLGRAHAHHVRLSSLVPGAAALAGELLANLVPDVLRVDEHAVEVEDDRFDLAPLPPDPPSGGFKRGSRGRARCRAPRRRPPGPS